MHFAAKACRTGKADSFSERGRAARRHERFPRAEDFARNMISRLTNFWRFTPAISA